MSSACLLSCNPSGSDHTSRSIRSGIPAGQDSCRGGESHQQSVLAHNMRQRHRKAGDSLLRLHPENDMPHLLKHPPDPKTIRHATIDRPPPHPLIVPSLPLPDPLPAHDKLPAAHIPDLRRHLATRHVEQLHVHISKVRANILAADVDIGGLERVDPDGASRVVRAAQVHVAAAADGVEAQVAKEGPVGGTEQVVVPLVRVRVDKGCVSGEGVVVVDYEGEVGYCFAAAMSGRDQWEAGFGRFRGGVDVWGPAGGRRARQSVQ